MFKTNEYFDGRVKSISYETTEGPASVGVMADGEYEFGTSSTEYMTIISGEMNVMLPGESDWKLFAETETFIVPAGTKFRVRVNRDTGYRCYYR
jgi:purine/pyrimidine-nucleoside phosphorylase